ARKLRGGAGGARARPQLEHLADEHERDDDRCRLEVKRQPMIALESCWQSVRKQERVKTEEIRSGDAQSDKTEHVELPGRKRAPSALEKRPARPKHDGRGESSLEPLRPGGAH